LGLIVAPYTVALVVDPEFGEELAVLAARVHTWAIDTPTNRAVAEGMWSVAPEAHGIESGVTTFKPQGVNAEEWCLAVIDELDMHHNHYSHDPAYSVLEVYGAGLSERIREAFAFYGLVQFEETPAGFIAKK